MDKEILKEKILLSLRRQYSKTLEEAKEYEIYYAVARATMDEIT